jgi:ATP-dependent Clp protease protease subunit
MNPIIIDPTSHEPVNVFDALSENRILFLTGFITDKMAKDFMSDLTLLNLQSQTEKITVFLNSTGGEIRAVFSIYDWMQLVRAPLEIIVVGACQKETLLLLVAGTKGMRFATPNSIITVEELSYEGSSFLPLTEAAVLRKLMTRDNKKFLKLVAKHTEQSIPDIKEQMTKKIFLTTKKALRNGFIDRIVEEEGAE